MNSITDATPKTVLTVGVVFALAVNFAAPYAAARKQKSDDLSCAVEVVYIEPRHFDVGSFSGGVQWTLVGGMLLPVTQVG